MGEAGILPPRDVSDGLLKIPWLTGPCHALLTKHWNAPVSTANVHDIPARFSVSFQSPYLYPLYSPRAVRSRANSHVNMRCKQTSPAITSPFSRCWGQTATNKCLKITLMWTPPQPLWVVFFWWNRSEGAMGFDWYWAVQLLQWIPWGFRRKIAGWVAASLWVSMESAEGGEKDLNWSQILNVLWLPSCDIYILLPLRRYILSYWTLQQY